MSSLVPAVVAGDERRVIQLLEGGAANPDEIYEEGATILHFAASRGMVGVARSLLDANADVGARDWGGAKALHRASSTGNEQLVRHIIESISPLSQVDIEVNDGTSNGTTALHLAAEAGFTEVVALLLRSRASVSKTNQAGTSPLHLASRNGRLAVVEMLLGAGANDSDMDRYGFSA